MNKHFAIDEFNKIADFKDVQISSDYEADLIITGYIIQNKECPKALYELLDKHSDVMPYKHWLTYFCMLSNDFGKYSSDISTKAGNIINEISDAELVKDVFCTLEYDMSGVICPQYKAKLLKKVAGRAYYLTKDKRYSLFSNYAWLYSAHDVEKLEEAVRKLDSYLSASQNPQDNRVYCYLLILALQRLAVIHDTGIISSESIGVRYECCFDEEYASERWHVIDYDSLNWFDACNKIRKYNCPEAANIFRANSYYYDARFLHKLHETVAETIKLFEFSSEQSVLSQKFVFLSQQRANDEFASKLHDKYCS